ncbi:MAG: dihydropteroate synthase [Pseudanabaenaceae cyanobacterium]
MIREGIWQIEPQRTYIMGVLNVTPDSFSDGGLFYDLDRAIAQAEAMLPYIDILDIGGESTRPGAEPVSVAAEIQRVVPVIVALRQQGITIPISVDTTKAEVAKLALQAGANAINDVSAGRFEPEILRVAQEFSAPVILMHMQGEPRTMQTNPTYTDVVKEVQEFLRTAIDRAQTCGISKAAVMIDPGIGFGKTLEHNLLLIRHLASFKALACPILVGVSRKSFIGKICDRPDPRQRIWGTAAACAICIANGANVLRVHDVQEMRDVAKVADALCRA